MAAFHGKKQTLPMSSKNVSAKDSPQSKERKVWGRRKSRPLSATREQAMETLFPALDIPKPLLSEQATLNPDTLFTTPQETWMEIGFGGGEHIIGLLDQTPGINILGAEPFLNGMANFIKDLPKEFHPRTRVIMDDAMILAHSLSDACLSRLYILNPDPWHKKRHYKRRIVNTENLSCFARILKPGGQLIMTTDVLDLADWMITQATPHPDFEWTAQAHEDWATPPKDWIKTRYETKGAKGAKKMCYLTFIRR